MTPQAQAALSDLARFCTSLTRIRDELETAAKEMPPGTEWNRVRQIQNALSNLLVVSAVDIGDVARIEALAKGTPFQEKAREFIESANGDSKKLAEILAALKNKIEALQIRGRIGAMAVGTQYSSKALEFVSSAGDNIDQLLGIESALKEKLEKEEDQIPY